MAVLQLVSLLAVVQLVSVLAVLQLVSVLAVVAVGELAGKVVVDGGDRSRSKSWLCEMLLATSVAGPLCWAGRTIVAELVSKLVLSVATPGIKVLLISGISSNSIDELKTCSSGQDSLVFSCVG